MLNKRFIKPLAHTVINTKREFFEIEPEQAIALLKLIAIEDVTPDVQAEANSVDADSQIGGKS